MVLTLMYHHKLCRRVSQAMFLPTRHQRFKIQVVGESSDVGRIHKS